MKRITIYVLLLSCWLFSTAQSQGSPRPSLYDLVNQVRTEVGLDHSQFDKVYSAYEKFDKAVFGDYSRNMPQGNFSNDRRPGGHRPGGSPGMGRGKGPGRGHDMNGTTSMGKPGVSNPPTGNAPKPEDFEKMLKKSAQQEEKLDKTMKKLFKKDLNKYSHWKKLRERQFKTLFPTPPAPPRK